ncbi:beta-ketoacyl-ACP reductase [Planotetraspora thailandica]|uniref:Beta-ketoacyl-ACP reductase n=1 Tax=Planotetraspora thailandica TaxID=487172 RepID=A0A8J3Y065_9ACTN|nr:SDR family NAD(P)-dependent oxidoreductase [Planotetraspora thailandica]GII58377.1 beta-ketoacyl-ACP reductase [Planotetraspora thailandica]
MLNNPMNTVPLAGKIAIITGGARGLGRDIAEAFHATGAQVVISGRDLQTLTATAKSIDPTGESVVPVACDNTDEQAVAALAATTIERFGRIDVLVNNTGIPGPTTPLWEYSQAEWRETIDTNLTGTFLCCRAVLPTMIEQRSGSIVTVGSATGKRPNAGRAAYAASKTGLIGLTRTLALEAGPYGVRVNLVSPGAVDSDRFRRVIETMAATRGVTSEEFLREAVSGSALGRLVQAADVAGTIIFLAGDAAASITGEDINVSAGLVMY